MFLNFLIICKIISVIRDLVMSNNINNVISSCNEFFQHFRKMGFLRLMANKLFRNILPGASLGMNVAFRTPKDDRGEGSPSSQSSEEVDDRKLRTVVILISNWLKEIKY